MFNCFSITVYNRSQVLSIIMCGFFNIKNCYILLFSDTMTSNPEKKRPTVKGSLIKSLFTDKKLPTNKQQWSVEETSALTQYICLFWEDADTDRWPMQRDKKFWDDCANAVNKTYNSTRTGMQTFQPLKHPNLEIPIIYLKKP
jgi:hypothetical protein